MSIRHVVAGVVLVAIGALACFAQFGGAAKVVDQEEAENIRSIGRFQFTLKQTDAKDNERGVLCDTATGHCWALTRSEPPWQDLGTPIDPATKRAWANVEKAQPAPKPRRLPTD